MSYHASYDCVIVGSGINSLVCAALLAKAGTLDFSALRPGHRQCFDRGPKVFQAPGKQRRTADRRQ